MLGCNLHHKNNSLLGRPTLEKVRKDFGSETYNFGNKVKLPNFISGQHKKVK